MNFKADTPHRKVLNSMRQRVAKALARNGYSGKDYCPSFSSRASYFLHAQEGWLEMFKRADARHRFEMRKSRLGQDILLCRTFLNLYKACQLIDGCLDNNTPPEDHICGWGISPSWI